MRVALVHDWLLRVRGGERVLDELAAMFPHADLYTLIHDPQSTTPRIERLSIVTSPVSALPFIRGYYRLLAPVFPTLIERFHLRGYDLVISSSHSFAKGVRVDSSTPHLCYCHTPIRYAWGMEDAYLGTGWRRMLTRPLIERLRRWDRRTSTPDRITRVMANSHYVAERIQRAWLRTANVVYPGVDASRFQSQAKRDAFFLLVGGFVPYKAERLAIDAFRSLGLPLVIAGDGPLRRRIQAGAPSNVSFTGRVSENELAALYGRCRALIYPQEEDFGLIAVEAQAAGAPVIAYGRGGATETVVSVDDSAHRAPTGLFFTTPNADALTEAVRRFERIESEFRPAASRTNAERFSVESFRQGVLAEIEAVLA